MRWGKLVFALAVVVLNVAAFPQDHSSTSTNAKVPSYLLRMDRMHQTTHECVLLRGDGQFHFEREVGRGDAEIFEDILSPTELQRILHIVSSDELFFLKNDKIETPLIKADIDELAISVHRPGYWQDLLFSGAGSRQPYRQSVDPLLGWLESLRKGKHLHLNEDESRTNCNDSNEIEPLKTRGLKAGEKPSTEVIGSGSARVALRSFDSRFLKDEMENSCVIVYDNGQYHFERKSQRIGAKKMSGQAAEGVLDKENMDALAELLNDSHLKDRPYQELPREIGGSEWEIASLFIPRGKQVQRLAFWTYHGFGFGYGRGLGTPDNGIHLIRPLQKWLQKHVEPTGAPADPNAKMTGCKPQE